MLSNEDKDQIRQLQQDHKEGLLSDLDFNSMRQTVVEQAQLRFVVEQTIKRQRIEQFHQSEEPRVPEERIEQLFQSPTMPASNSSLFFLPRVVPQHYGGDNLVLPTSTTLTSSSSQEKKMKPTSSFLLTSVMPLKGNVDLQKDKSGYCNFLLIDGVIHRIHEFDHALFDGA